MSQGGWIAAEIMQMISSKTGKEINIHPQVTLMRDAMAQAMVQIYPAPGGEPSPEYIALWEEHSALTCALNQVDKHNRSLCYANFRETENQ